MALGGRHLPYYNPADIPVTVIVDFAVIFRADAKRTGILAFTRNVKDADIEASVFGTTVDPTIFP